MILITSAKYSPPDFTLEFGKIPPSFLPLGNKRLYEYQARLFKDCKKPITLSLPKSFKMNAYDKNKLENLGINLLFVPENLSLGESIVYCVNLLSDLEQDLTILHGDTFFQYLDLAPNSFQVTKVKENYDWAYLDDEFCTDAKTSNDNLILAGAFNIQNPRVLIKNIVENEYKFIKGLKAYSQIFPFKITYNETWLDFGLITSYFHSKKAIKTQRIFNELCIEKGYLKKNSQWTKKIEAESFWFENLPQELLIHTPRFIKASQGYLLEYLCNNTLAELFVFGSLPSFIWKRIFESVRDFLNTLHSYENENLVLNFDYETKTLQRLEQFSKESKINLDESLIINHKEVLSIKELLARLKPYLKVLKVNSLIHGDFCFSNIMFDFRAGSIKTFDPRGLDFNERITNYGDKNYDFAKLAHSVFGLYDFIMAGFFHCKRDKNSIEFSLQNSDEIKQIQQSFLEIFKLDKAIYALMIHLFLSMLPLHNDDENRQIAFLANAYRLYDEFFKEEA